MKIIGFSGSPRKGGNTDTLLNELMRGASDAGADTEIIRLIKHRFDPCISCNRCYKTGRCMVEDGFQEVFDKTMEADHIVIASPIYFMALSAWTKTLVDRFQCLWARKYVLEDPVSAERGGITRKAVFIATAGSRVKRAFEGAEFCLKFLYDVLGVEHYKDLTYFEIDDKGDIKSHPSAMKDAYDTGVELVKGAKEAGG
jgi:multimeric flavodoxin WrbA